MKIPLPTKYDISYPNRNKKYYNPNNKKELAQIFTEKTKHCMFCGKSLLSDGELYFHLDHSVDKKGNYNQENLNTMLLHCKYNFTLSCMNCNIIYKKQVEKLDFNKYTLVKKCPTSCLNLCSTYKKMRKDYCEKNAIILPPFGYMKNNIEYKIRYNLLRHVYEADMDDAKEADVFFVENHIMRFHLNAERFTSNVIDLCVEVDDLYEMGCDDSQKILNHIAEKIQPNVIGNEFIKFLKENFINKDIREMIDFCKLLVILDAVV